MHLLLGGASGSEIVGLAPAQMVVIETDGSIEQEDTLKAAYAGAAATSLHVARDPLDAALLLPEIAARQIGVRALAGAVPRPARSARSAGAASIPTGTTRTPGFLNPSVYCPDLLALIRHIRGRVLEDLNASRARNVA